MEKIKSVLIVADAGPLIHLDELTALDVLRDYSAVLVPDAVWNEVSRHRPQALEQTDVRLIHHPPSLSSPKIKAIASLYTLHHGEQEALSLCLTHSINTLTTDDTAARLAAKTLNIKAHGTLGLLIRAVRKNFRTPSEVLFLLSEIPQRTTLHVRPSLLKDVINTVRTEWNITDE
ncbi:MAG: hypothetical protein AB7U45_09070 [Desulfamplus sp.]